MEKEITITLQQLENLLYQQKQLTAEKLLGMSYYYNTETRADASYSMTNIDKEKFKELANKANYPNDLEILKKYLK